MAKTKAELLAEAKAKGVEVPASTKKADITAIVEEAAPPAPEPVELPEDAPASVVEGEALSTPEAPLAHTPFEPLTEYAPLGKAVDEPGFDAPKSDDGEASDDSEEPLEATPSETEVLDTTEGSTRPEDGAA
jgi:hypothetical protein